MRVLSVHKFTEFGCFINDKIIHNLHIGGAFSAKVSMTLVAKLLMEPEKFRR